MKFILKPCREEVFEDKVSTLDEKGRLEFI
jgi:hypothetical protein